MAAFWMMIAVVVTVTMAFVSVAVWIEAQQKERQAHYRNEMARRIAEAADPAPVLEYVREIERADAARVRTKTRLGGLITLAVGAALMIFLHQLVTAAPVYLAGLIPLLIGVMLLVASELVMRPRG